MVKRKAVGYPKKLMEKMGYTVDQRKNGNKKIFSIFFKESGELVMQVVKMKNGPVVAITKERCFWGDKVYIIAEKNKIYAECYTYSPEGGTSVEILEEYL